MFYPMFAMVVLTVFVGLSLMFQRIAHTRSGAVDPRIFKLNQSKDVPDKLIQLSNNYSNLFEVPILFYLACIVSMIVGFQGITMVTLAWLFVISRIAHSFIHMTMNKIIPRLIAFISSVIIVSVMWIILLLRFI
jgi:hypothetical protein